MALGWSVAPSPRRARGALELVRVCFQIWWGDLGAVRARSASRAPRTCAHEKRLRFSQPHVFPAPPCQTWPLGSDSTEDMVIPAWARGPQGSRNPSCPAALGGGKWLEAQFPSPGGPMLGTSTCPKCLE